MTEEKITLDVKPGTDQLSTTRKTLRIHITHTDLDAAGCEVVFRDAFGVPEKIYTVNHDRIDDTVKKVLYRDIGINPISLIDPKSTQAEEDAKLAKATHGEIVLWITDISPSEIVLDQLRVAQECFGLFTELFVCDHHPTTDWLGKDKFAKFAVWQEGQCGAWLAYDCGIQRGVFAPVTPGNMSPLREFVNAVDAYDLWKLDSAHRKRGEELNKLFKLYGFQRFAGKFSSDYFHDRGSDVRELVAILDEKVSNTIAARIKDIKRDSGHAYYVDRNDHRYMLVLDDAGDLTSQLGHAVLEEFEALDYVVIVRANGVLSMRSRDGGVDVGAIAKRHGGGGHPGAAGFKIDTRMFYQFLLGTLL